MNGLVRSAIYKAGGLQVYLEGAYHGKKAQTGLGDDGLNAYQGLERTVPKWDYWERGLGADLQRPWYWG